MPSSISVTFCTPVHLVELIELIERIELIVVIYRTNIHLYASFQSLKVYVNLLYSCGSCTALYTVIQYSISCAS